MSNKNILIVESDADLAEIWEGHLARAGFDVWRAEDAPAACQLVNGMDFAVIILNVVLERGSAFTVVDIASDRNAEVQVIFVTNTRFFSDGSIFQLCSNACAFVRTGTQPDDLTAMVSHYARTDHDAMR